MPSSKPINVIPCYSYFDSISLEIGVQYLHVLNHISVSMSLLLQYYYEEVIVEFFICVRNKWNLIALARCLSLTVR